MGGCRALGPSPKLFKRGSLAALVEEYRKHHATLAAQEAEFFRLMPSVGLLIHHVAFAIDGTGRCFDHQFRIMRASRQEAQRRLTSAFGKIKGARSFDELHAMLLKSLSDVYGLGELYVYDTAQRIGNYLGLSPKRVYLHAGVREGAKALGLDTSRGFLEFNELPKALQSLPADEVENFLCIYKKHF